MRIIRCDLHARQQTLAMLDTATGEVVNRTLMHEGTEVPEFYSQLPHPVLVGIEAINFLSSAAQCVLIIGADCEKVETLVANQFESIALREAKNKAHNWIS
jgi:acyl-coenzyme A thioesterase PaaI-like protein